MSKRAKRIILAAAVLAVLLIAAACVGIFCCYLPYRNARSAMPENFKTTLQKKADQSMELRWPALLGADSYRVEVYLPISPEATEPDAETQPPEPIFRQETPGTSCTLPSSLADQELTIEINSIVEYEIFGKTYRRLGDCPLSITLGLDAPAVTNLSWSADPDTGTVHVSFDRKDGDVCQIYLRGEDGSLELWQALDIGALDLSFGEGGAFPMPGYDESCTFVLDAQRQVGNLTFYGIPQQAEFTVVREDLLGRNLELSYTDIGHNVYVLTWNETKGERYVVQTLEDGADVWTTMGEIPRDGERTYTTDHLATFSKFAFRVVAMGGQVITGSDYAALSQAITVETGASPIYCTVWPVSDLDAYSDPQKTEVVGSVSAAKAYCVLDESYGMFGVRLNGQLCYIDSDYCMINLPEYLGELCSYDITNSYDSLYMVHEYEIPEVTGEVVLGYENVRLSGGGYLVPLLYPSAQKLTAAAQSAIAQGYRLKIYDSFRPHKATRDIYDRAEKILDDPLPEETYTGKELDDLPEPKPVSPEASEPPAEGEDPEEPKLTYREVMTGSDWSLNSFLAAGSSMHNLGIALDLTLEYLEDGRELTMQTSIHDLSCYSVLSRNNGNANLLSGIMRDAGFGTLVSEWWHFQDNEARSCLSLSALWSGVSPECWMCDDTGWRYRRYNGAYFTDCAQTIDGVTYTFDNSGYVTAQETAPE